MVLLLNNDEVRSVLDMKLCMEALEEAYKASAMGEAANRNKTHIFSPTSNPERFHRFKTFEGAILKDKVTVLHIVSDILSYRMVHGVLREEKLPIAPGERYVAFDLLFSVENGELLAIIPIGFIQRMRVGGSCGLATKYMARQNAEVLGLIGSGWQAGAQVLAHSIARPLKLIKVYSPNREHRERFAREMSEEVAAEVIPVDSPEEAAREVDILAEATNSRDPLIKEEFLRPGIHISSIIGGPDDAAYVKINRIIQRDRVATNEKAPRLFVGDVKERLPRSKVEKCFREHPKYKNISEIPSLGEVIAGMVPGRDNPQEITYFDSDAGLGIEFAAVDYRVYEEAKKRGLGQSLPSDWFSQKERP